jgi:hypothetical protein
MTTTGKGGYKQRDSSDDDDDLNLAVRKPGVPNSLFNYSDNEFDHFLDDKDLDEDVKRIEYADSRKRESLGHRKGTPLEKGPQEPSYEGMTAAKERAAMEEYQMLRKKWRDLQGLIGCRPRRQLTSMTVTSRAICVLLCIP